MEELEASTLEFDDGKCLRTVEVHGLRYKLDSRRLRENDSGCRSSSGGSGVVVLEGREREREVSPRTRSGGGSCSA